MSESECQEHVQGRNPDGCLLHPTSAGPGVHSGRGVRTTQTEAHSREMRESTHQEDIRIPNVWLPDNRELEVVHKAKTVLTERIN